MKTRQTLSAAVSALILAAFAAGPLSTLAVAASSEVTDLDPKLQAQVARQRVKQRSPRRSNAASRFNSDEDCGAVNIGNNNNDRSARSRINPRNSTIVVTGPVINAANCR